MEQQLKKLAQYERTNLSLPYWKEHLSPEWLGNSYFGRLGLDGIVFALILTWPEIFEVCSPLLHVNFAQSPSRPCIQLRRTALRRVRMSTLDASRLPRRQ